MAQAPEQTTETELIRQVSVRVRALLALASPLCARHRCSLPEPRLRFDLRGLAAGQAVWRRDGPAILRFNLEIAREHRHEFLEQTVTHEVAHLITGACFGRVRPHGEEWRSVMRMLGVPDPRRCHGFAASPARRERRWPYVCNCSRHELSTTRHNRIRNGSSGYRCRQCGSTLRPRPVTDDG